MRSLPQALKCSLPREAGIFCAPATSAFAVVRWPSHVFFLGLGIFVPGQAEMLSIKFCVMTTYAGDTAGVPVYLPEQDKQRSALRNT